MCGLYGWVGSVASDTEADLARGRTALSRLQHRGPDHQAWHQAPGVFLGHARLAILDLSPAAHQPFRDGESLLLTNGEVYNFRELAATLPGETWKTTGDTEVVARLLGRSGEAALPRFNGMFALAHYDMASRRLLLARDRTGIKPLYYRFDGTRLEFASELKAFDAPLRPDRLREVLAFGHFEAGYLPHTDIRELPPGSLLRYVPGKAPEIAAWLPLASRVEAKRFEETSKDGSAKPGGAVETLRGLLDESVALHLRSDAPLGALCSGGLDSSLVAALAKRHRPDLTLYHCGSSEGGGEEAHARRVAQHLGLPLRLLAMDKATYWRLFPTVTWHLDLPIYHPNDVSLYHIASQAKVDGIKVLLAGEGADELFGGYAWHRHLYRQLKAQSRWHAPWRDRLEGLWRRLMGPAYAPGEAFAATAPMGPGYPGAAAAECLQGLALSAQGFKAYPRWQELRQTYRGLAPAAEAETLAFMLEDMHGHLGTILHRTDRVLMGLSIEGRVPFLENALIDFALNLPLAAKLGPGALPWGLSLTRGEGKHLLKRVALAHLPREIVYRRKQGFPVAWQGYLPQGLPSLLREGYVRAFTGWSVEALASAYALGPTLAFRLIALEVFGRLFEWKQDPASIHVLAE